MNFITAIESLLPALNILVALCLTIGGFFAVRSGYSKKAGEVQEGVIAALEKEVKLLRRKIEDIEKERSAQDSILSTIRHALMQYGLQVIINGEFVTINDNTGKSKVTQIKRRPIKNIEEEEYGGN